MSISSAYRLGLIASAGMFLSTLDSGIISIALPTLLDEFNTPINHLIWVVTLYTLTLSATIMLFGKLADSNGRLNIYKFGLWIFAISSLMCGFANNANWLIVARGIQGIGAAMMQATTAAIIMTSVPTNIKAKLLGLFGMIAGLGPLMGPVLGGIMLSTLGWRWIFWINIPICLLAIYALKRFELKEILTDKPLNLPSLIMFGLFMASLLIAISTTSEIEYFNTAKILYLISVVFLTLLILREAFTTHPILSLNLFKNSQFVLPLMTVIVFGGSTTIVFILPPLFFENIKHYQPWEVGLISMFAPIGLVIFAKISGHLIAKCGEIKLMIIGLLIMLASLGCFTLIKETWGSYIFIFLLLSYGIGAGLFQTPNLLFTMNQAQHSQLASVGAFLTRL